MMVKVMKKGHISVVFVSSHRSQMDFRKLRRNGVIIAEALARYMYNLSDKVITCMKPDCMYLNTETLLFIIGFISQQRFNV